MWQKSCIQNIIPRLDKSLLISKIFNSAVVEIYVQDRVKIIKLQAEEIYKRNLWQNHLSVIIKPQSFL